MLLENSEYNEKKLEIELKLLNLTTETKNKSNSKNSIILHNIFLNIYSG